MMQDIISLVNNFLVFGKQGKDMASKEKEQYTDRNGHHKTNEK